MDNCTHCHSEITHTLIEDALGRFCCQGCQQVFHILNQDEFSTYHHLLEIQNSKPPRARRSPKYQEYLEQWMDHQRWAQEGTWVDGIHQLELSSAEIHCAACSWLLEKKLSQESGVKSIYVDFVHGRLHLKYDPNVSSLKEIFLQSAQLGYPLKFETSEAKQKIQRSTLIRLALSGAVMMNVMTFSYGGYFAIDGGMGQEWRDLFAVLSAILNLPVVTYCAYPFYKKAWSGIQTRVLHMDLPVSLGIITAYILSLFLMFQGDHPYFDSVSGLVFFLLAGRWFSQSFERWLTPDPRWYQQMIPQRLELSQHPGQFVDLKEMQEHISYSLFNDFIMPVKSKLLSESASLDGAWMTGESQPVTFKKGEIIPSGYRNLSNRIDLESQELFVDSQLNQLQSHWLNPEGSKRVSKTSEKIVPYFVTIVLVLTVIRGFLEYYLHQDIWLAIQEAVVILIISCPCALALSQPISLGVAMKRAREMGYLLRNGDVFSRIQEAEDFIFDKTGTLTWTWHPVKRWVWAEGLTLKQARVREVLASLCSQSHHPYSQSVREELGEESLVDILEFEEKVALGIFGKTHEGTWGFHSAREQESEFQNVITLDGEILAWIEFESTIRPQVKEMIKELQLNNKNVHILSGDKHSAVEDFCNKVGVTHFQSECTPESKALYCREIQSNHQRVVAIGDGMNDTLLLKEADISIMVQGGQSQVIDEIDVMSLGQDGLYLNRLFKIPQILSKTIRRAYALSIAYNIVVLTFAFLGFVAPLVAAIAMPLSTLSVLLLIRISMNQLKI